MHRKSKGNKVIQKYGVIYASDARLKAITCNETEDAAVAEIAHKKDESYNKKCLYRTGIVHRQAAKWAVNVEG